MFKNFFTGVLFLLAEGALAATVSGKIIEVEEPTADDARTLVMMEGGEVLRVEDSSPLAILVGAKIANEPVEVEYDSSEEIDRIRSIRRAPVPEDDLPEVFEEDDSEPLEKYEPTDLGSVAAINGVFRQLTRKTVRGSICSNRAHVWAYRMWKDHGIKSMKAFLFFSSRYIRTHNGKWWYHVTPFTYASGTQYATDRTFMRGARELSSWATYFVGGRYHCEYIPRYRDYRARTHTGWCFVRRVPMTVWMPWGVQRLDTGAAPPANFSLSQVRQAVRQALSASGQREFYRQGI